MSYWQLAGCAVSGFAIVMTIIPLTLSTHSRWNFLRRGADFHHGNAAAIPRLGGLALAAAFVVVELIGLAVCGSGGSRLQNQGIILCSCLAMFAVGFWDDLKPLGAKKKLLLQVLIATAVCASGIRIENLKEPFTARVFPLQEWGYVITILWLVATTNLINLIDGVDGLAGGICLMLMSLLAYECSSCLQLLAAGMAGALLGFLRYNFPPARIYMGDGGAYLLGFQIGLFSLVSSQKGSILAALVAPMFVLALPIVDVSLAILRRGLRGLPVFRPDRRHLHHHLLDMGFSRRKVVISIYAVSLVFMIMGFFTFWSRGQWTPILVGTGALLLLICAGGLRFSREWFFVGRIVGNSLAMRQDIQAALHLTRWLTMEARRKNTPEALWREFVFVAERIGFCSLKLTLQARVLQWEGGDAAGELNRSSHEVNCASGGVLELCSRKPTSATADDCEKSRLADVKTFNLVSEVLAEGWANAMKNWENIHGRNFEVTSQTPATSSDEETARRLRPTAAI